MTPVISPARQHRNRHHHRPGSQLARAKLQHTSHSPIPQQLHSHFALQQLREFARHCIEPEFVMLMAPVFGLDIAPPVYLKLQAALQQGDIANPAWQIVSDGFYPAEYDSHTRVVRIHGAALDYVQANPQAAWELLEILLHEFGHHLDTVLREDLADQPLLPTDAPADEGTRYAARMASAGWPTQAQPQASMTLASYTDAQGQAIVIDIEPQQALRKILCSQASIAQALANQPGSHREPFEASGEEDDKHSHQRIEKALAALGFSEPELQAIYFGNWLRDYSQLLDPKLVRGPEMPKDFPKVLSRSALTEIIDILAARKFAERRLDDPQAFKVTQERLGVYRPCEHIDNPRVEPPAPFDLNERDKDFEPWTLTGDPLLEVDFDTSIKRYMQRSISFMHHQLRAAMQHGRSAEGLRRFGSALHVLEDLFAHSNFVELGLIKLGHRVLPWTSPTDCKWGLPLVTGRFAGSDVIASLAQPIARLIAPAENWQLTISPPGELSDTDRMLLVLLGEHSDPQLLKAFEGWLDARDLLRATNLYKTGKLYAWLKSAPLRLISNAYNEIQRGVLTLLGNNIDDAQTLLGGDPNQNGSSDPSHSQLAKDHADHPLHEPAALLAMQAITPVAKAMLDHWNGQQGADPLLVAERFFSHPNDSDWQDELLAAWAKDHAPQIELASSAVELGHLQQTIHQTALDALRTFENESNSTWQYMKKLFDGFLSKLADLPDTPANSDTGSD